MPTGITTRWGIDIPQVFLDGPVDMMLVRSFTTKAESLGYHSVWVLEQLPSDFTILEPISLLSYAAALTSRLKLGTSVLIPAFHNPAQLAKSLASLDQISGGRLIVGVGLGNVNEDYPAFGISPQRCVRRFVESVEIMKALWTQPSVVYRGDFWQLDGFPMEPKSVQQPHPPFWFGGQHPAALKRAVRYADGWMGGGYSSTARFRQHVQQLQKYLEEAQRDPSTFPISKRVYIAVDADEARARRRLLEWVGRRYNINAEMAAEVAVWGSVARCIDQLAEIVGAGAQLVLLNPVFDHLEQLELLAEEVIPNL